MRRTHQLLLLAISVLPLGGCNALGALSNPQAITWFALQTYPALPGSGPAKTPARLPLTLLVAQADSNPFYNSTQIAYSRSDIARAYYQFAAWTERPAKRVTTLASAKLRASGHFAQVASQTDGIIGDLELNLRLEELYHDATSTPQQGRISLTAVLIDLRNRQLIARKSFAAGAEVQVSDATNAVRAISRATDTALNELAGWAASESNKAMNPKAKKHRPGQ